MERKFLMSNYLKISEFADRVGVTPVTVRNWEKRGWIEPHHRTPSGYRYYTKEQAEQIINGTLKFEMDESSDEN